MNEKADLPEGTVLITDSQTAGRGQRGNSWEAEPGSNLTFSLLLRPRFLAAMDQFRLNMAVALAIATAVKKRVKDSVKLKWPNDIFINEWKVGGILIENQLQGDRVQSSIAGIGLNVNQETFLSPQAASLRRFSGKAEELNTVFQDVLLSLDKEYLGLQLTNGQDLKKRYYDSLYKFREQHQFESNGSSFNGTISGVDEQGQLCIETEGVTRKFSFKEVKYV